MMQCPQCRRTYAEDFTYCLDDGTRLVDRRAMEKTLILPTPEQLAATQVTPAVTSAPAKQPTTVTYDPATAAGPAAPSSNRERSSSLVKVIVVVVGMIAIVMVWGAIKLGLWWLDHNQQVANQNLNSSPIAATASPSPSIDPLSLLGISGSPLPSPSASVSTVDPRFSSVINIGTYQCEIHRNVAELGKQSAVLRLQITFNGDGTYLQQGFVSIPAAGLKEQLAMEEKGNYTSTKETLVLSNRLKRELILQDSAPWSVPTDGSESREKLRNVSVNTFQVYDNEEKAWFTFVKI
jgi:hypothetical protein